jgi:hypothetical protein
MVKEQGLCQFPELTDSRAFQDDSADLATFDCLKLDQRIPVLID